MGAGGEGGRKGRCVMCRVRWEDVEAREVWEGGAVVCIYVEVSLGFVVRGNGMFAQDISSRRSSRHYHSKQS